MSDDTTSQIAEIKLWVRSFRADIPALEAVLASSATDREARRLVAAAMGYLVTRMDLVPDWNETIGIIDDAFVVRVCLDLATAHRLDEHLGSDTRVAIGRLLNQIETVQAFLGDELYGKLRKHCARLVDKTVRGRTTDKIVDDEDARRALFEDVSTDLLRMPAASFEQPDDVAVRVKSYLHHKLS